MSAARAARRRQVLVALGLWLSSSCAAGTPPAGHAAPPSASSAPTASPSAAHADPSSAPSTSAPVASAATPPEPEPSPRCVAQCNAEFEASRTSMCKFCRAHQIGAPADRFEEMSASCERTCEREWRACLEPCERKGR